MNNRNRAIVWVLAVFLIGAASGGGMVYLFMAPRSTAWDATTRPQGGRGRENPEKMIERLNSLLGLTDEQKAQMKQIFDESRQDYHKAFTEVRTKTHRKMEQVLTPEQMQKFDEFWREREKERERRNKGDKPGPPPAERK